MKFTEVINSPSVAVYRKIYLTSEKSNKKKKINNNNDQPVLDRNYFARLHKTEKPLFRHISCESNVAQKHNLSF